MVSHFLLSSSSPSIWGKLLFSTTDVKRSKFPRASRTKRMMTNAPKYCCCTLLLRLFHPRFWQKYQSQYYTVPMAANIPFLSPSFQLSEIEKRIFGAFSIFSWSTSEASSSSLIWASSSRRTHPLLFFGSKVGKLEKGGILRLLSSSTKARQLSSWRREQRKGEKKEKKGDETTTEDFIEENVKLLINLICWCCCRRGCTVGKISWKSSIVK